MARTRAREDKLGAEYSLTPSGLEEVLAALVPAKRPVMVWGPPGVGKSQVARKVAKDLDYEYVDVRALLLDPVDLRGLPWRDGDLTRWAPPAFLPEAKSTAKFLINLEELPSAPPMVQAALYQLVLDRACGEYKLPEGAAVIACGNRESDRGVAHRMPTPLASRFIHVDITADMPEWMDWAVMNDLAYEVIFFIKMRPELLHDKNFATSRETAFPCPRTWEFVSDALKSRRDENGRMTKMAPSLEKAIYRGTVGEGAAVEFFSFLRIMHELPHPSAVLDDPHNAPIPENPSTLLALCAALYGEVGNQSTSEDDEGTIESVLVYADRLRPEVGEFLIGSCVKRNPFLQTTRAYVRWCASQT